MSRAAPPEYEAVLERYLDGFNEKETDALAETVTEDVVVHGLFGVDGDVHGIEEYGEWASEMLTGVPDAHIELSDVFGVEDRLAARFTVTGTQEHEMFGLPATGEEFEITGLALFRMENERIAEKWYQQDDLGMLRQTGVVEEV